MKHKTDLRRSLDVAEDELKALGLLVYDIRIALSKCLDALDAKDRERERKRSNDREAT